MNALHTALILLPTQIGNPTPTAPPGSEKFLQILGWVLWGAVIVCIGAAIAAGAKLAVDRNQGRGGDGEGIIKVVIGAVVIGSASAIVNLLVL